MSPNSTLNWSPCQLTRNDGIVGFILLENFIQYRDFRAFVCIFENSRVKLNFTPLLALSKSHQERTRRNLDSRVFSLLCVLQFRKLTAYRLLYLRYIINKREPFAILAVAKNVTRILLYSTRRQVIRVFRTFANEQGNSWLTVYSKPDPSDSPETHGEIQISSRNPASNSSSGSISVSFPRFNKSAQTVHWIPILEEETAASCK